LCVLRAVLRLEGERVRPAITRLRPIARCSRRRAGGGLRAERPRLAGRWSSVPALLARGGRSPSRGTGAYAPARAGSAFEVAPVTSLMRALELDRALTPTSHLATKPLE